MDELKDLIAAVSHLPTFTVWVLAGFLLYKLAVIGSVYGTIKFVVEKIHDYLRHRGTSQEITPLIAGIVITGHLDALVGQMQRLRGKGAGVNGSQYIHKSSVDWLREAIDAKEAADRAAGSK